MTLDLPRAFILCLLWLTALAAIGLPPTALAKTDTPVINIQTPFDSPLSIGSDMFYIEDPAHQYTLDDVRLESADWQSINRRSPNFGFTDSAFWFRFDVNNESLQKLDLLFELPIPFLDRVRMIQFYRGERLREHLLGDAFPYAQRPIDHQNLVMPISFPPGTSEIYLQIRADGTVEAPLTLWSPKEFARATAEDRLLQGIWFGIVGIMVIYNLFLYFFIRDTNFLYYVGFVLGYLMFQICLKGYGYAYLWPDQIYWNSFAIATFIALCNLSANLLVIKYLRLKKNDRLGYRIISAMAWISGFLILLTFVAPYSITVRVTSSMTVVSCTLALFYGYRMWLKGDLYARYFCVAWTAAFSGVGVFSAAKFGVLPANFWTNNAGQIGVMMLVALLSLALANRFNREKELRLRAQEASLEHEKVARQSEQAVLEAKVNANLELENKVKDRTQTLEKALQELEVANERLELLSTTDALTGLYNRGYFEQQLETEFKRAIRHQRELSLILCDIDHFKMINDTFGHKVGDDCLREVSALFREKITRSGDVVARYGGEEFIIMLVDTPLQTAIDIAGSLGLDIKHIDLTREQRKIPLTASFGVASLFQAPAASAEQLVHRADMAMYDAKRKGRDLVKPWDESLHLNAGRA